MDDNATLHPFAALTLTDATLSDPVLAVSVQVNVSAQGHFTTLAGFTDAGAGLYTFSGTADDAQAALRGLIFTPTNNQVATGATVTTSFTVTASDGLNEAVGDNTTTVVATSINDAPVLGGGVAEQPVNDNASILPFATYTISDVDSPAQTLSVSIQLSAVANGTFTTLAGFNNAGAGLYTFSGNATAALTAIRGLVFKPTVSQVELDVMVTTTFTVTVNDGIADDVIDETTSVVATAVNHAPILAGALSDQAVDDDAIVAPFSTFTITDTDRPAQRLSVSVQLSSTANGTFTTLAGFTDAGAGLYTFTGTANEAQVALRGLAFTPVSNEVAPGASVTTTFSVSVDDGVADIVADSTTSVVATSINNVPVLGGGLSNQAVNDDALIVPFAAFTISDADAPAQTLNVSVRVSAVANGSFTTLAGFVTAGAGLYTFSGTAVQAQTALRSLVFKPTASQIELGDTITTTFAVTANDGLEADVTDSTTSVTTTAVNHAPLLGGAIANQSINDNVTVQPFATFTIGDTDQPAQTLTVVVQLSSTDNGSFTMLGGFVDAGDGQYAFSGTAAEAQAALRSLVFTPVENQSPATGITTTFAVTVDDGLATAAINSVTSVTSHYRPPVIVDPGAQTSAEADAISLAISASDPEGHAFTYSATNLPGGLIIDPVTGVISGTLDYNDAQTFSGVYNVTVSVTDSLLATTTQPFTWNVADTYRPPVIVSPGNQTGRAEESASVAISAVGPEGFPLTYSAIGLPQGLTIDNTTGLISGVLDDAAALTNSGLFEVNVSVTDGHGAPTHEIFTWTVLPPLVPVVNGLSLLHGIPTQDGSLKSTDTTVVAWMLEDGDPFSGTVQIGWHGDGSVDATATVSNGFLEYNFAVLGQSVQPDYGPVTVQVRGVLSTSGGEFYGAWKSLSFNYLQPTPIYHGSGPYVDPHAPVISGLRLLNNGIGVDTGSTSQAASLVGMVTVDDRAFNGTVELDIRNDAGANFTTTVTVSNGVFSYRLADAVEQPGAMPGEGGLSSYGTYRVTVSATADGPDGSPLTTRTEPFDVVIEPALPAVDSLLAEFGTAPYIDSSARILMVSGTALQNGVPYSGTIAIHYSGDLNGQVTTTATNGIFTYTSMPGEFWFSGSGTIDIRAYPVVQTWQGDINGNGKYLSLTVPALNPPQIMSLYLLKNTGTDEAPVSTSAVIAGTVTQDGNPFAGTVQFDYNGDGLEDATADITNGKFSYDAGLIPALGFMPHVPYGAATIKVRAVDNSTNSVSAWRTFSFTYVAPPIPTVGDLHVNYTFPQSESYGVLEGTVTIPPGAFPSPSACEAKPRTAARSSIKLPPVRHTGRLQSTAAT